MESEEVGRRTTARSRKPNITLDMEGVLSENLRSLKNTRRGHLANVTANVNGVQELLSDDRNLQEVKEKLAAAEEAFLKFKDAHLNYAAEIGSEEDKIECDEYFTGEERKFRDFYWTTSDWITRVEANLVAQSLQVDSEVKPEDSVSCAGVGSLTRASRTSKRSSRASSRVSRTSSLFVARAKEAARVAELKAERSMLDKRQVLEEQKFRLKQEELRLNLEAEIVKTVAKEQALAAIAEQSSLSVSPKPVKREDEFHEEVEFKPPPVMDRTVLNSKAPEWTKPQAANPDCGIRPIYPEVPVARGTAFDGSTKLQEQQNALQLQQTRIMEMLAINQNKGKLPQPRVPTFDGSPVEYRTFVRAFKSLIESRTSSSTERLYYLEQYTTGDVKELVRSCHHLAPDEGYAEARRLIEKKFGDDFRIASAYESKALNWPPVKSEDGSALSRFSVYLASCKNAMKGSQYSSKFDQPDNIQKLIYKLPYNMKERWRRVVDDIMELQGRPVKFDDLVSFIDREARIATNPVFGQITESSKILEARSSRGAVQKLLPKSRELSLAAQVNTDHGLDTEMNRSVISIDTSQYAPSIAPVSNSCCFCNLNHALEDCRSLRSRPYQERIQFIASKGLCFGCLSDKHIVKDCPQRKSCKFTNCPKKHPTVLHTQPRERLNGETSTDRADNASCSATQVHNGMVSTIDNSCSVTGAGRPRTGMAIVPVKVKRKGSDDAIVKYAFLDNGSSSTFCTESLMKQLGIEGLKTRISLTTLEKKGSLVDSFLVQDLVISDLDENNFISLPVLYTRTEIPVTKDDIPTQEDADLWPHLNGVYLPNVSAEIGLLIASDVPEALDPLEVKNSEHGGPYASRTRIGWVVNGPLGRYHQGSHATSFFVKADTELQRMVEDFYNLDFNESVADNRTELSQDERRFMASVEGSTLLKDGHYEIPLPFKDRQYSVPNNRIQAEQRASWLKKRLEKNPRLLDEYKAFVEEIVAKGYARKVPPHQRESGYQGKTWFIPHHGVYHPHKPGKIRVVFNCSAKYQGKCLNDLLLKGPDLTNSLLGVLTRFRQDRVAVMADIEAMFHQVRVPDPDCSFLRFLWWPDGKLSCAVEEYQMTVHLFGAVSSPACSNFAVRKTAEDNAKDFSADAINTVRRNFYVDDCLKSLPSVEDAVSHVDELRSLLQRGGFRLTKWISNSREVLESIPESERAQEIKKLDLQRDELPIERALGVQWRIETDKFGFNVNIKLRPPTRRGILSVVGTVFDPFGFAAPFVLTAKKILQDLCRIKLSWDDEIPIECNVRWQRWLTDLPKLSQFAIERCLKPANFGRIVSSQLHHFSDASEIGFGSVSYLRLSDSHGGIHCTILQGKSRLVPLKQVTIPRLELSAAVISVQLDKVLKRELDLPLAEKSVFWTDSTSVLRYIRNETKRFHTFVANRIAIIRDGSDPDQWRHVGGDLNPADDLSRGLSAEALLSSDRWIKGPAFLWEQRERWPQDPLSLDSISDADPEVKVDVNVHATVVAVPFCPVVEYFRRTSSWHRLKKSVAWFLRYRENLRLASTRRKLAVSSPNTPRRRINIEEMKAAELQILKCVQLHYFSEELQSLTKAGVDVAHVKKTSGLRSLDPVLVDGLLRVGGRLDLAPASFDSKHQIILPKSDHVSTLIIEHCHLISGHSGREYVLSLLREKFWIVKASSVVRRVLSKCVSCRRRQRPVCEQKMADLPVDRLTPDQPPFTSVGVDYFGPFQVKRGRSLVKRYGVIFTCLAIRAVHIEVAHSLDTDSFLLALRRFIARRGQVKEIRSDNGTNFSSGEKELRESINAWNQEKIHENLLQRNIKWSFNPPYGSHYGGVWERCIRTTRKILQALLREQTTDDEGLVTLLCEVESIMNGRPITTVSSDPQDQEPLTPNHLLLLRSESPMPPGLFRREDQLSRRRWRQVQYLADIFWKRWSKEYLPLLQGRQKWLRPRRNLAVGDVVLVSVENSHRNSWPLGRIVEVLTDKKGFVRRAKVVVKSTVLARPIDKLCLLVEKDKSQ